MNEMMKYPDTLNGPSISQSLDITLATRNNDISIDLGN